MRPRGSGGTRSRPTTGTGGGQFRVGVDVRTILLELSGETFEALDDLILHKADPHGFHLESLRAFWHALWGQPPMDVRHSATCWCFWPRWVRLRPCCGAAAPTLRGPALPPLVGRAKINTPWCSCRASTASARLCATSNPKLGCALGPSGRPCNQSVQMLWPAAFAPGRTTRPVCLLTSTAVWLKRVGLPILRGRRANMTALPRPRARVWRGSGSRKSHKEKAEHGQLTYCQP